MKHYAAIEIVKSLIRSTGIMDVVFNREVGHWTTYWHKPIILLLFRILFGGPIDYRSRSRFRRFCFILKSSCEAVRIRPSLGSPQSPVCTHCFGVPNSATHGSHTNNGCKSALCHGGTIDADQATPQSCSKGVRQTLCSLLLQRAESLWQMTENNVKKTDMNATSKGLACTWCRWLGQVASIPRCIPS